MKWYKIQIRSQKNSQSCVPLKSWCFSTRAGISGSIKHLRCRQTSQKMSVGLINKGIPLSGVVRKSWMTIMTIGHFSSSNPEI